MALLLLAACSTTPDGPDDAAAPIEVPEGGDVFESSLATLPMPLETHLLLRFDPQQADHLAETIAPLMGTDGMNLTGTDLSGGDVRNLLFQFFIQGPASYWGAVEEVDLRGLDQSRPILVAVSSRGNENHLEYLEDGLLPLNINNHYRGLSWRLFLPAADLSQLQSDLESGRLGDPFLIRHLQAHDDYLLVDIHYDYLMHFGERYGLEVEPIDYGAHATGFWDRQTPAQAHFLLQDTAAGLYFKNESLATWAALSISADAFYALERATPDNRHRLLARGHMMAGDLLSLDGGDVREYEDISLNLTAAASTPLAGQVVRTYTATGAVLADQEHSVRTVTRQRLDDPLIDFIWNDAGDLPEEAVDTPQWMAELLQQESPDSQLMELFRSTGSWPYYIFQASYPRAFLKGLESFPMIGQLPGQMTNFDGVRFATGSLKWVTNDASPLGGDLRGHLVVRFHDTPALRRNINQMVGTMRDLTTEGLQLDEERLGDDLLYTVQLGQFESTTETVELDAGHLQFQIHTTQLEQALRNTPMSQHPQIATFLDLLTNLERGKLNYERTDQAVLGAFSFGDQPSPSVILPSTDFELAAPEVAPSGCLVAVRQQSHTILRNFERLNAAEADQFIEDNLEPLEEAAADCQGAQADRAQRIYGHWLLALGNQLVVYGDYQRASQLFEESCRFGSSAACEQQDSLTSLSDSVALAAVDAARFEVIKPDKFLPRLSREGFYALQSSLFSATTLRLLAIEDDEDFGHKVAGPMPPGLVETTPGQGLGAFLVSIDPEVSAQMARSILQANSYRDHWELQNALSSTGLSLERGPIWVGFAVDDGAQHDAAERDDRRLPVILMLPHERLREIPSQEVTITVGDDPSQIDVDGQSVELTDLGAHLDGLSFRRPPAFLVAIDGDLTFQQLVDLHTALDAWYADNHSAPMPFVLP